MEHHADTEHQERSMVTVSLHQEAERKELVFLIEIKFEKVATVHREHVVFLGIGIGY